MKTTIRAVDPRSRKASALIAGASKDQVERYGRDGGATVEELAAQGVVFAVASIEGRSVGCAAVLPDASGIGELSRMYVEPSARRCGVASALLAWLETNVLDRYDRLRLETGVHQPESIAFYEAHGFEPIDCWPPSDRNPLSRCYEKRLTG